MQIDPVSPTDPTIPTPGPDEAVPSAATAEEGADRRRAQRFRWPFVFADPVWGSVFDISESGICLIIGAALEPDACYDLSITNGWRHLRQDLKARVVWYTKGRAGLEWVDLTPEQQEWLHDCCQDYEREASIALLEEAPRFSLTF